MIEEFDLDQDGEINEQEFFAIIGSIHPQQITIPINPTEADQSQVEPAEASKASLIIPAPPHQLPLEGQRLQEDPRLGTEQGLHNCNKVVVF
ncbi:hypothetical protein H4Q26_002075, partial [Puccinia striiformis f. sp. tritici PST-130]